ncbi:energy transducer TonB [Flavobacterium daejeonense]|uniref:energy transducer TonB n=1 Tax=Flavobacterium daejeonense TaxID=350893 RepID=UPI00047EDC92|nr:energy transducer TonB [Flavobacterium daejeonense]
MKKLLFLAIVFLLIQFVSAQEMTTDSNNLVYNLNEIEQIPDFPGGMNEFYNFIRNNYKAPSKTLSDKVLVCFIIEKDGSLSSFKILKSVNVESDAEAVRVLSICPNWIPGEKNGQKVRCRLTLPISKLIYNYQIRSLSSGQKNKENVYSIAGIEKKPEFPGGIKEFHKFLKKNYKPSAEAKGLAFVTFIIEKDGSLSNFKLLRDPGFGAGEEALRVLSICPKWSPGETKGEKVRCIFSTSIPYKEPVYTTTRRVSE